MSATWIPSPRRRRRNQLLLAGLVPSVIAVVVAAALLVMLARQASGVSAERRGDHAGARAAFAANRWAGTVEHWIAPYNEGVATFRGGRYADALADFEAALPLAPPDRQCLVLHNIAVTEERLGDRRRSVDHWRRGRTALAESSCLESPVDLPLRERSQQLDERLREKILAELDRQARRELAAMTPEERAELARLRRLMERAEQREQDAEERRVEREKDPPPPEQPESTQQPTPPPDDDPGEGDQEVTYGW